MSQVQEQLLDHNKTGRFKYSILVGWAVGVAAVLGLVVWFARTETLPDPIRIATGIKGGQYAKFGQVIGKHLEKLTKRKVELVLTAGSVENREKLINGEVHLGLVQNGGASMDSLVAVAPLYRSIVHVVARKNRGISSVSDLAGKRLIVGPVGSGNYQNSVAMLEHYGIDLGNKGDQHFLDLADDPELDAAIVTTGFFNRNLRDSLLASGEYKLIEVDDAEAISILKPQFSQVTIPRGMYRGAEIIPDRPLKSLASTSFLVGRSNVGKKLVGEVAKVLYKMNLRNELPTLISADEARQGSDLPLHETTRRFLFPYEGIGILANFMESLAAMKELLFAVGAGVYLFVVYQRRRLEQQQQVQLGRDKQELDRFLNRTIAIERKQIAIRDPKLLRPLLNEVTRIKLEAMDELTQEDLRGDRMFLIFLTQCATLTEKLQNKIYLGARNEQHGLDTQETEEDQQ